MRPIQVSGVQNSIGFHAQAMAAPVRFPKDTS